ncbi:hypothetical protein FRC04_005250 [Tulasnella sp. 424]|nr:hypothetical protein FRC04_005250 [Tulasnella sp. 424]KAG8975686.1 hypothetical protein FRC05_005204 [Tulasnella sp. 425]
MKPTTIPGLTPSASPIAPTLKEQTAANSMGQAEEAESGCKSQAQFPAPIFSHSEIPRAGNPEWMDIDVPSAPSSPLRSRKPAARSCDGYGNTSSSLNGSSHPGFTSSQPNSSLRTSSFSAGSPDPGPQQKGKQYSQSDNPSSEDAQKLPKDKENGHASPSKKRRRSRSRKKSKRASFWSESQSKNGRSAADQSNAFTSTQPQPRFDYTFYVPASGNVPFGFYSTTSAQFYFQSSPFDQAQGQPFTAQSLPPPSHAFSSGPQSRSAPFTRSDPRSSQHRSAQNQKETPAPPTPPTDGISLAWATYCAKWDVIETSCPADIEVKQIPWPILSGSSENGRSRFLPPLSTVDSKSIGEFLLSPKHSVGVSARKIVKDALKWYHPDHFEQKIVARIRREDEGLKEGVRDLGQAVVRCLTALLETTSKRVRTPDERRT